MEQKISFGNLTDVGIVRKANEDYYASFESKLGSVFIVCDGMGGHVGGAIASQTAVLAIKGYYEETLQENCIVSLQEALILANDAIHTKITEDGSLSGMGTTAVLVLISKGKLYYGHIGDSRLYGYAGKKLQRITSDHSFVQSLVDGGHITEAEAEEHPNKNQITKALGIHYKISPSICQSPIELKGGMQFLICTDGLTGIVNDEMIAGILSESATTPQDKVKTLVELANKNGGTDNITVQLIQVGELSADNKKGNLTTKPILKSGSKSKFKPFIFFGAALLVLGSIYAGYKYFGNDVKKENLITEIKEVEKTSDVKLNSDKKDSMTELEAKEQELKFDDENKNQINDTNGLETNKNSVVTLEPKSEREIGLMTYTYRIIKGDTDNEIGKKFHTTWDKLKKADPTYKEKDPKEGETIVVKVKMVLTFNDKDEMQDILASPEYAGKPHLPILKEKKILIL